MVQKISLGADGPVTGCVVSSQSRKARRREVTWYGLFHMMAGGGRATEAGAAQTAQGVQRRAVSVQGEPVLWGRAARQMAG